MSEESRERPCPVQDRERRGKEEPNQNDRHDVTTFSSGTVTEWRLHIAQLFLSIGFERNSTHCHSHNKRRTKRERERIIMPTTNNIFSYSSNPLPVKPNRKKYKDDEVNLTIMSDPRVVRGMVSTSLKKPLTNEKKSSSTSSSTLNKRNQERTREETREETSITSTASSGTSGSYSYHVRSLVQDDIDVTQYLIEDTSSTTVPMKVHETQTDQFYSRPVTPEYIPRKTGIDRSTQVENLSELFIFDDEVEPMLHVIISKTLEQSIFELERESELFALETEIELYHHQHLIEQQWIKKREEESIADACIKDLALKGMKEKQNHENNIRIKIASRQSMLQILPKMIEEIGKELYEEKIWKKPSTVYVTNEFIPEMIEEMKRRVMIHQQAKELLDGKLSVITLSLSLSLSVYLSLSLSLCPLSLSLSPSLSLCPLSLTLTLSFSLSASLSLSRLIEILWEAAQKEIILPTPPPTPPPVAALLPDDPEESENTEFPRKILLTIHLPLSEQETTIGPFEIEEGETIASLQEKIQVSPSHPILC
jgi:hypothetical protein